MQLRTEAAAAFVLLACIGVHGLDSPDNNTCKVGTFWVHEHKECLECEAGSYQSMPGMSYCTECKPGKYSTQTGATSEHVCSNCASGKYAQNRSTCLSCPSNTISPAGSASVTECTSSNGYYSSSSGRGAMECPVNYYCVQGTTVPTPCPKGTISGTRATQCVPGVTSVILYDWIFGSVWILLFFSGVVALGLYKHVFSWYKHTGNHAGVIQIKIIR